MKCIRLSAGNEDEFFRQGTALARLADAGKPLPREQTISFEDPAELLRLLSSRRLDVLRSVKDDPGSIAVIAERLRRDRKGVKRDVDQLALAGLVTVQTRSLPGHGLLKEVRATAARFRLQAVLS